jgi:hypothetical protein
MLDLIIPEWSAAKKMADEGKKSSDLTLIRAVRLAASGQLISGLPWKHWMYMGVVKETHLPLSLFHPRWVPRWPSCSLYPLGYVGFTLYYDKTLR